MNNSYDYNYSSKGPRPAESVETQIQGVQEQQSQHFAPASQPGIQQAPVNQQQGGGAQFGTNNIAGQNVAYGQVQSFEPIERHVDTRPLWAKATAIVAMILATLAVPTFVIPPIGAVLAFGSVIFAVVALVGSYRYSYQGIAMVVTALVMGAIMAVINGGLFWVWLELYLNRP